MWGFGEIHPRTLVHLPSNVCVFSFPYQAHLVPTTHTPPREACHPTLERSLPLGQPGEVANPAPGQLNRENEYFPVCPRSCLRIWSRETHSIVPSRVSLLILQTQAESGAYSRDSSQTTWQRSMCLLLLIDWYISHVSWCQNPARGHKIEKRHPEGKNVQATLLQILLWVLLMMLGT